MFFRRLLSFFAVSLCLSNVSDSQDVQTHSTVPVDIRVVLHDPSKPNADLYYIDKEGEVKPVSFRYKNLSRPFSMSSLDGSLVFYDKAEIDPKDPGANLESIAVVAKIPSDMRKGIVVVARVPSESKPSYRMMIIEDSPQAFPPGESIILPLLNTKVVVQAGEHVIPVRPGQVTRIPFVEEKNKFNMAQTNFHYQREGEWITIAERRVQYLKVTRRIFIIYFTPGATHPTITAIMDNSFQSR